MYSRQKNPIVKVELVDKVFIQYILIASNSIFFHFSSPYPICKLKFLEVGQTVVDESYRRLISNYGGQKNHIVKVELGEYSFVQYIFVEMSNCFKYNLFPTFYPVSPCINWNFSERSKPLQMKLLGLLHMYMYGSQENHTVKVELGETSFVQYILVEKPVFVVKSLNWPESS